MKHFPAHLLRLASLLLVLGTTAAADTLVVPDDYPDLCSALENVQPGDVIVVRTTAEQYAGCGFGSPLPVRVPLTILGDPICNITMPGSGAFPSMQLSGPGYGDVTLVNLDFHYAGDPAPSVAIAGGGFDELHLVDSAIHQFIPYTGVVTTDGSGVAVDVRRLLVQSSYVSGAPGGSDGYFGPAVRDGSPAIDAPGATVLLFDSRIAGGAGSPFGVEGCVFCTCPASLASWGAKGGPGVIAGRLFSSGSSVHGGAGATIVAFSEGGGPYSPAGERTVCGTHPTAPATIVIGDTVRLPDPRLVASTSQIALGEAWTLTWTPGTGGVPPVSGLLLGSFGIAQPVRLSFGWLFLEQGTAPAFRVVTATGPTASILFAIPPEPALLGRLAYAQILSGGGITRPVGGAFVP